MDLDQVSTTIFEISKLFDALFQMAIETVPKLPDGSKLDPLKDVYVSMNNMMVSWGNTVVKQANYFQENVCYFLKYQSKQVSGFQEVIFINALIFLLKICPVIENETDIRTRIQ